ncbi:MAG: PG0541 family transporter-associated protein [Bacteroidales bacterium]|jgi:hypothetical protein|nr:hypothetical protein [Bacteroidales bacterium]
MKFIYITFNITLLGQILEMIDGFGFQNYQVLEKVLSKTAVGDPRMDSAVWPSYSAAVIIQACPNDKVEELYQDIEQRNQNRFNDQEFISLVVMPADKIIVPN